MRIRLLSIAILSAAACFVFAQEQSKINLPQDKGPDKIDVSGYPAELQSAYKLFTSKCSKCHTIARPINTKMQRPEWERYVKRMMHKPNSGISDKQGKEIFDFLVYDQTNRKDKNPNAFFPALSDDEIAKLKAK
ncbi:MAG: photosystem P840 reaction-center cytochrome c-551 [Acidobacteria bacterium]|nr:photosystem P840 reaction-center cytochrome c-551 [Acidobacteriota bacterium]